MDYIGEEEKAALLEVGEELQRRAEKCYKDWQASDTAYPDGPVLSGLSSGVLLTIKGGRPQSAVVMLFDGLLTKRKAGTGRFSFTDTGVPVVEEIRLQTISHEGIVEIVCDSKGDITRIQKTGAPPKVNKRDAEEKRPAVQASGKESGGELAAYLYDAALAAVEAYHGYDDVYALTFVVDDSAVVGDREGLLSFAVDCAREGDCPKAGRYSEERWNYACWSQRNAVMLIDPWQKGEGWERYAEYQKTVGLEYTPQEEILLAMLDVAAEIGLRLQEEGHPERIFGRSVPVIIHDLEYWDAPEAATRKANPHGEAADFLEALVRGFE